MICASDQVRTLIEACCHCLELGYLVIHEIVTFCAFSGSIMENISESFGMPSYVKLLGVALAALDAMAQVLMLVTK